MIFGFNIFNLLGTLIPDDLNSRVNVTLMFQVKPLSFLSHHPVTERKLLVTDQLYLALRSKMETVAYNNRLQKIVLRVSCFLILLLSVRYVKVTSDDTKLVAVLQ